MLPPPMANIRSQPYWLHGLPRFNQSGRLILLGIAVCIAMLVWIPTWFAVLPAPTFAAYFDHAPVRSNDNVREKCPECGVVSSTRKVAQAAAVGSNYWIEVTVRMKDGSNRQFTHVNSANWQVGERMIIIDSQTPAGE